MKRFLAVLLIAALLAVPVVAADVWFVAVNDTVPLTLSGDSAPYYVGSMLYAPRSVLAASGLGITPSYNESARSLALFSRDRRIVFYLDEGRAVDESGSELPITVQQRGGALYLPITAVATHFGLSASFLTDAAGYRVLRFTNGGQVYDDSLFLQKAANLIAYRAQQYQAEQTKPQQPQQPTQPTTPVTPTTPDPPKPEEPEREPATVYLAITGADTMERDLALVSARSIPAAFFLTADEIEANPELVCAIRAAGYPVGLTVDPASEEPAAELARANEALDALLSYKTLFALLTKAQRAEAAGYLAVSRGIATTAANAAKMDGGTALVILSGAQASLNTLREANVKFRQLRETTYS